jgi:hypothetical protein
MVTITQTRDDQTTNLVIVDTAEDAEAFLDKLAGRFWGVPGMLASRDGDTLVISAKVVGGEWRTSSIYTAVPDAA